MHMNPEKMTHHVITALQEATEVAAEHHNQELQPAHLLRTLSNQADSAFRGLLNRAGVTIADFLAFLDRQIADFPTVSSAITPDQLRPSRRGARRGGSA